MPAAPSSSSPRSIIPPRAAPRSGCRSTPIIRNTAAGGRARDRIRPVASIVLEAISKRYAELEVIQGVALSIAAGEFVVFVGPSGCGKSTLLRMIAGLEEITGGALLIDGQRMN